ncbi:MAG: hypothetical protein K0R92_1621 [Lachnospiraceae bacterium]|nr:hypothetical protein [Lachnospiraceae bacterium]
MSVINSKDVINIIRKALNLIDYRLVNHGERVGYILYKMMQYENIYSEKEILEYTISGLFHDIGAYKTEEIDNLVKFETNNVLGHSIYGYLFFKYLSPLDDFAEAILYHHIDYEKLVKLDSKHKPIAEYLNLADRIDVYKISSKQALDPNLFLNQRDKKFSARALELFQNAQKKYQVIEHIEDESYINELNQLMESATFTSTEKEMFLYMLAYSIDFRSEYTVKHNITTVSIADEMGKLMNLPEEDRYNLHYGALLHDIGKITTPLDILEAPRKLTYEEMMIMKQHVAMSEAILKDYIHPDILEIAIRHHEKLDGSGYHKGLTAEQLTLPQRILAVTDIISALTGKRSYKDSFETDKIISILTEDANAGKLDKDVVECVIANLDTLISDAEDKCSVTLYIYQDINNKFNEIYNQISKLD